MSEQSKVSVSGRIDEMIVLRLVKYSYLLVSAETPFEAAGSVRCFQVAAGQEEHFHLL